MKIIDLYILKSYLRRLFSVFVICMLIFVMQTLWLFVDELAGKGIGLVIVLKFLLFYSPKLVPLVLPLSVLLAALMTYGMLAENYEFAAMKSTGISLQRMIIGLFVFHIFLGMGAFHFANHVIPYGELKFYNLRRNLTKLKPALAIREGVFNKIGAINIKVKRKHGENDRFLEDVIIHECYENNDNNVVIKAERGELKSETTDPNLQLVIYDGNRYEDIQAKDNTSDFPFVRLAFKQYTLNIDLSQFNNVDLSEERYRTFRVQKVDQLRVSIDSLEREFKEWRDIFGDNFNKQGMIVQLPKLELDEIVKDSLPEHPIGFVKNQGSWEYKQILQNSISEVKSNIKLLENKKRGLFLTQKRLNLHKIELNNKFVLAFSPLVLFLVGASLGAIIRKGGIGLPLVLSIAIFLTYHYIGIFGKNAAEDSSISPFFGTWLSTFIMTPFAIMLIRRASADKGLVNLDAIFISIQNFLKRI